MKNIKCFLVSVVCIATMSSCSKDDDSGAAPIEIPADEKFMGSTEGVGGLILNATVSYTTDRKVRQLNYESVLLFDFDYFDNRIAAIEYSANGQIGNYAFAYDAQGHLASFSSGELLIPLDYNPLNNSYTYFNQNSQEVTITLTEDGDIRQYLAEDIDDDDTFSVVMTYHNEMKGAMSNSNAISLYMWLILDNPSALFYVFPFSKRPLEIASISEGGVLIFENSYDSQDFISSVSINAPNLGTNSTTFNYITID